MQTALIKVHCSGERGATMSCKASAKCKATSAKTNKCKNASMHHFSLLIVPPLYHCKAAPLISLPFTVLLGRACSHTQPHTRRHTRTLCLFLSSVSPPAQTLCAQPYNQRSVTRARTVPALCCTHPSLCVAPPLLLPE